MMNPFDWTTCLWPEHQHPMPLCRHVWERHLRERNGGGLPVTGKLLDRQWDMILSFQGDEDCPCSREMDDLLRDAGSPGGLSPGF